MSKKKIGKRIEVKIWADKTTERKAQMKNHAYDFLPV
jgi:hypothetical protein